jgi:hypothetical protein
MIPRFIIRSIAAWCNWKAECRYRAATAKLHRMCPEIARDAAQRELRRKAHRSARDIERRQRARMNGLLEG